MVRYARQVRAIVAILRRGIARQAYNFSLALTCSRMEEFDGIQYPDTG
jgi:hypothetical protein